MKVEEAKRNVAEAETQPGVVESAPPAVKQECMNSKDKPSPTPATYHSSNNMYGLLFCFCELKPANSYISTPLCYRVLESALAPKVASPVLGQDAAPQEELVEEGSDEEFVEIMATLSTAFLGSVFGQSESVDPYLCSSPTSRKTAASPFGKDQKTNAS